MKKASLRDLNQIKTKHSRYFLSLAFLAVKLRATEVCKRVLGLWTMEPQSVIGGPG